MKINENARRKRRTDLLYCIKCLKLHDLIAFIAFYQIASSISIEPLSNHHLAPNHPKALTICISICFIGFRFHCHSNSFKLIKLFIKINHLLSHIFHLDCFQSMKLASKQNSKGTIQNKNCTIITNKTIQNCYKAIELKIPNQFLKQSAHKLMQFWFENQRLIKSKEKKLKTNKSTKKQLDALIDENQENKKQDKLRRENKKENRGGTRAEDILKLINIRSVGMDETFVPARRSNACFIDQRNRSKLIEKKIAARAFCYRGYGVVNFRAEIILWSEMMQMYIIPQARDNPRRKYSLAFTLFWKKLERSMRNQKQIQKYKRSTQIIGHVIDRKAQSNAQSNAASNAQSNAQSKEESKEEDFQSLYRSVSESMAGDMIRRLEESLQIQKHAKMPYAEIKYLKSLVLNSKKFLVEAQYEILTRLIKEVFEFEKVKVVKEEMSQLYMAFVDMLKIRMNKPLTIEKTKDEERLKHLRREWKYLHLQKSPSKSTEHEEREQEQKLQQIEEQFISYYLQTQDLQSIKIIIVKRYGEWKQSFGLTPRHMLQKIGRKAYNKLKLLRQHYGNYLPSLIKTNDIKTKALIISPSAISIRIQLFKTYLRKDVDLAELANLINNINEYFRSIPEGLYNYVPKKKNRSSHQPQENTQNDLKHEKICCKDSSPSEEETQSKKASLEQAKCFKNRVFETDQYLFQQV